VDDPLPAPASPNLIRGELKRSALTGDRVGRGDLAGPFRLARCRAIGTCHRGAHWRRRSRRRLVSGDRQHATTDRNCTSPVLCCGLPRMSSSS